MKIMNKFLAIIISLLLLPFYAQADVTVTSPNSNEPGHYIPLTTITGDLNTQNLKNANTWAEFQQASLDQSAIIHQAVVNGAYAPGLPTLFDASQAAITKSSAKTAVASVSATPVPAPLPFTNLQNVATYIENQREMVAGPFGSPPQLGLPLTYYTPPGTALDNTVNEVVTEASGLYDTSLAIIALIKSGDTADAKSILDIYTNNSYGGTQIFAAPSGDNKGSFYPFSGGGPHYLFDFAKPDGVYYPNCGLNGAPPQPPQCWDQYGVHTGPNAWLAIADAQYVAQMVQNGSSKSSLQKEIDLMTSIGDAMILLQNNPADQNSTTYGLVDTADHGDSQGAVRYSPSTQSGFNPNSAGSDYDTVNTENNLDAYAAFNALYAITGQTKYQTAAQNILGWMQNATVYNSVTGMTQHGMMDPSTGLFYTGLTYDATNKRWDIQTTHDYQGNLVNQIATDSGGTWAISALTPKTIDETWGVGTADNIYNQLRNSSGRNATVNPDGSISMQQTTANTPIDGLDYNGSFFNPSTQGLISPEWTGGGINAANQLINYYQNGAGQGVLTSGQIACLSSDVTSMTNFVSQTSPNSYAFGPGLTDTTRH